MSKNAHLRPSEEPAMLEYLLNFSVVILNINMIIDFVPVSPFYFIKTSLI